MDYKSNKLRKAAALTWALSRKSQSPDLYRFNLSDSVVQENGDVHFPSAKMDIEAPYIVTDANIFFILNYLDNRSRTVSTFVEAEES